MKDIFLSPSGKLYLDTIDNHELLPEGDIQKIESLFNEGFSRGLLLLGTPLFAENITACSVSFDFWQQFSQRFIRVVCRNPESTDITTFFSVALPSNDELQEIITNAPFIRGYEYLTPNALSSLWQDLNGAIKEELKKIGTLRRFIHNYRLELNLVGRICFHLAEKKHDTETPFAFLATYTTAVASSNSLKHLALGNALQEYSGAAHKNTLVTLLVPLQKSGEQSIFIKNLIDSGEIFHPLAWTAQQAYLFLKDIPLCEAAGIVVRVPNWWNSKNQSKVQVVASIGANKEGLVGLEALRDFNVQVALQDGQTLTDAEWQDIIASQEPFVKVKGQWVEIDAQKLQNVLDHWKKIKKQVDKQGLTFAESMRLLAGMPSGSAAEQMNSSEVQEWSRVNAGDWLKETLDALRSPDESFSEKERVVLQKYLHATLRPYQLQGVQWLFLLYTLKLGGCLADDMGLGKTIQVIGLLILIKYHKKQNLPHLLVVPASLLGNWQAELKRFAPDLNSYFLHPSRQNCMSATVETLEQYDVVITTYSFAQRFELLGKIQWDIIILDEAQAIKNPNTKQRNALKDLPGNVRLVLTGTPIENSLTDLWSLFDFFAPGLLGALNVFADYVKKAKNSSDTGARFYRSLRRLINPYMLRRLKTDKRIIVDLPDKTELPVFCSLTKKQVHLYQQAITEFEGMLNDVDGINKQGLIFNYLMRFKQICNHPDQWLGYGAYDSLESGKLLRLQELCQEIAIKQEKVLIFTQFQEIVPVIASFLTRLFNREGFMLHGGTPIKKRGELVERFTHTQGASFFVISLRAGGTGLNLTTASHVIHFDRWWNPAVENQATDRAYRIGQKKNVMVYKFMCQGTIEEKIDALINSKKVLSADMLKRDDEIPLSQLSNEQLLDMVKLDIHKADDELEH